MKLTYTPPEFHNRPRRSYEITTQKSEARERAIDKLITDAADRNDPMADRFYWMLVHDMELAPMTTNAAQLLEIGIDVQIVSMWEIINGLADLGIYLLNTNYVDDLELLGRLKNEITQEPVRDLPPTFGVNEFVDIKGGSLANSEAPEVCNRDDFMPKPPTEAPDKFEIDMKNGKPNKAKALAALVTKKKSKAAAAASTGGAN